MSDLTRKHLNRKQGPLYSAAPMAKHTGIKKLSNGRFRARYFQGYDAKTGKRVYPARTFDTERQAREWRSREIVARGSDIVEGRGVTLSAFLDHWLSTKINLRENSLNSYRANVDLYIKPALGHIKLSRLTPSDIEDWQSSLLQKVSATVVAYARSLLHGALASAGRKNLIRSNAVEKTDGPKVEKAKRYPLTIEEALKIMDACQGATFGLAYQLMTHCGLRPEESLGLSWADLDLSANVRGSLQVNRVVQHYKGGVWRFHKPKTRSSERAIKFPSELAGRLLEHRKTQLEQKLRNGKLWKDYDLVFTNDIGEPLKRTALEYRFNKLVQSICLPKGITMYALRHFFVTSSLVAGVDIKTASREAGHASVSFTLEKYGHVLEEMHETAASKREQLLKSRSAR